GSHLILDDLSADDPSYRIFQYAESSDRNPNRSAQFRDVRRMKAALAGLTPSERCPHGDHIAGPERMELGDERNRLRDRVAVEARRVLGNELVLVPAQDVKRVRGGDLILGHEPWPGWAEGGAALLTRRIREVLLALLALGGIVLGRIERVIVHHVLRPHAVAGHVVHDRVAVDD